MISVPKALDITTKATAGEITRITFKKPIHTVEIKNKSTTDTLYVSFDFGETWIALDTGEEKKFENLPKSLKLTVLLKSSGVSQPARIIYREWVV